VEIVHPVRRPERNPRIRLSKAYVKCVVCLYRSTAGRNELKALPEATATLLTITSHPDYERRAEKLVQRVEEIVKPDPSNITGGMLLQATTSIQ
jgi:hypothetical protein